MRQENGPVPHTFHNLPMAPWSRKGYKEATGSSDAAAEGGCRRAPQILGPEDDGCGHRAPAGVGKAGPGWGPPGPWGSSFSFCFSCSWPQVSNWPLIPSGQAREAQ